MSRLALALLCLALSPPGWAEGREFPLTWGSGTVAAQSRSIALSLTPRLVRGVVTADQAYSAIDLSAWVVHGISRAELMVGLETTIASFAVDSRAVEGRLVGLWRQRLLEPTEVVGLAVLGRATLGLDTLALEARAIIDRQLGRTLLALNAGVIHARYWAGRRDVDTWLEQSLAGGFALGGGVTTGAEVLAREAYLSAKYQGTAVYVGPTFALSLRQFRVSAGVYAQVASLKPAGAATPDEPLEVKHNERFWLRLIVSAPAL
jgi:hypothetical protein